MRSCIPSYIVTFYIRYCWYICTVHQARIIRSYSIWSTKPSVVTWASSSELNPEKVNMTSIVENLIWSCERTFQVIILIYISSHTCAGKRRYSDWVRNPFIKDDFKGYRRWSKVTIELNLEKVSLDQSINRYTLIFRLSEPFSSDSKRYLTLLEVKFFRSPDGNNCFLGVGSWVKGAISCWNIIVEITFRNSIEVDNRRWNIRLDINDNFTPSQDISFG